MAVLVVAVWWAASSVEGAMACAALGWPHSRHLRGKKE